jgi:hypothetical protein
MAALHVLAAVAIIGVPAIIWYAVCHATED